jgi:hypothetical protein
MEIPRPPSCADVTRSRNSLATGLSTRGGLAGWVAVRRDRRTAFFARRSTGHGEETASSGKNSLATCGAIKERRTAFSAPNKELSAKPKQQSQINCPARAKLPLTGESPIQVSCESDFLGSDFRKGHPRAEPVVLPLSGKPEDDCQIPSLVTPRSPTPGARRGRWRRFRGRGPAPGEALGRRPTRRLARRQGGRGVPPIDLGWRAAFPDWQPADEKGDDAQLLPALCDGEIARLQKRKKAIGFVSIHRSSDDTIARRNR